MRNKIYENEKQTKMNEEKYEDLFFACEQNEEKIDETIFGIDSLKFKFCCLESRFKELENVLNDRFVSISKLCQNLEGTKADKSFITDQLMTRLNAIQIELKKIEKLEMKFDSVSMLEKSLVNFQDDIKKSLIHIKVQIDDKMERNIHKDFRTCFLNNFEQFIKELRIVLSSINQKAFALGSTTSLESNVNCVSCKNNILMKTELSSKTERHLQDQKRSHKKTNKLKPVLECHKKKSQEIKSFCSEHSFVNFPIPQQFFIISHDNSIFKADPIECLKNSNYKRV
ncbi:unnamed protein product [Chironomus riparius]|uniref:Uncharacterized protein n=1 Tax=Chironomus riparius TaxID=315576 RepID=A0A9P0N9S8_9DIPT|nr:unnamed protein product [Chironomus riparius]